MTFQVWQCVTYISYNFWLRVQKDCKYQYQFYICRPYTLLLYVYLSRFLLMAKIRFSWLLFRKYLIHFQMFNNIQFSCLSMVYLLPSIIQSSLMSVRLKLKISVTTEPIGFYSSGYIPIGPVVVLSYFYGGGSPPTSPPSKKMKIPPPPKK